MGADLICYIAFDPERIDAEDRRIAEVARQVREYLDACIAAAERVLLGEKDVPDPRQVPIDAKRRVTLHVAIEGKQPLLTFSSVEELRAHPTYRNMVQAVLAESWHEVESKYVFASTPEELAKEVREFVDFWNDGCARDLACRPDPEHPGRKVVVAGELSWGDEPDGFGYQTLKRAFGLGIAQALGVT